MRRTSIFFVLLSLAAAAQPRVEDRVAPSLNVMTFNIRYNNLNDGVNAWPNRKTLVAHTIRFHRTDLVGVQEALHEQLEDLSGLLPEFKWLGVGRDDGKSKGEYSAILYRHERFETLEHGDFWLSETPEEPGSVGWDAAITRMVTWAKFKDRRTGKTFFHFNTHFDHIGQKAREESAKLLRTRFTRISRNAPTVITGDFNANEASSVYAIMTAAPPEGNRMLRDTRDLSVLPHHGPNWTFNGFGKATERFCIDYIFVSAGARVLRHAAIYDFGEERYPSDHLPVLAEVVWE